jgi:metal-responsive CopG/Arc/MetJ family transcriptional regulator
MPTVNFSVPEDVKQAFDAAFEGQNKSAVIAELMREAVKREQGKQRSQDAYLRIPKRRKRAPTVTQVQLRAAREEGRP